MRSLMLIWMGLMMTQWNVALAAVGCSLRNPDADIRRFFPTMTDYSIHLVTFENQNRTGHAELGQKLGGALDPVYEQADTPYTLYVVNQRNQRLGYVFGTNQRGKYSNIQVIAVVDSMLDLQRVYLQKIRSPLFEVFQSDSFGLEMASLSLSSYPSYQDCFQHASCDAFPVQDPTNGSESEDFRAIIRALAKLHILSETLLLPGKSPTAPTRRAMAEWIGNVGGIEPSRLVARAVNFVPLDSVKLHPNEPVVLWQNDIESRIFRLYDLQSTPIVTFEHAGHSQLLAWSDSSQTATIHPTDHDLRLTSDLLFGVRLLYEPATGSRVSPILGETVYGGSHISLDLQPGVGVVPAGLAMRLTPSAVVFDALTPVTTRPLAAEPVGPVVLVRRTSHSVEAWMASSLRDESDVISRDHVQFWMTLEGFRSTFPNGTLHPTPGLE